MQLCIEIIVEDKRNRSSSSTSRGRRRRHNIGTSAKLVFKMSSADAMYGLLGGLISNQIP